MSQKATGKQQSIEKRKRNLKPRWKKGQSGNPKGRPRKFEANLRLALGGENIRMTGKDLSRMVEILLCKDQESLLKMAKRKDIPAYMAGTIKAICDAVAKGDWGQLNDIYSRAFGRPTEFHSHVLDTDNPVIDENTPLAVASEIYRARLQGR